VCAVPDAQAARQPRLHYGAEERVGRHQNGELIHLAEMEFALFITSDQNVRYQQNLTGRRIAIIELSTNDLRRILAASYHLSKLKRHIGRVNGGASG
jgi:hypothetical protein